MADLHNAAAGRLFEAILGLETVEDFTVSLRMFVQSRKFAIFLSGIHCDAARSGSELSKHIAHGGSQQHNHQSRESLSELWKRRLPRRA